MLEAPFVPFTQSPSVLLLRATSVLDVDKDGDALFNHIFQANDLLTKHPLSVSPCPHTPTLTLTLLMILFFPHQQVVLFSFHSSCLHELFIVGLVFVFTECLSCKFTLFGDELKQIRFYCLYSSE